MICIASAALALLCGFTGELESNGGSSSPMT